MSQDPELECLVADTSVTRTPALRCIRRVHEGGGQGTPVELSLATGQPFTVLSSGEEGSSIPREVIMEDGHANRGDMQTLNGKRFKIFAVPTWDACFSTYCFQLIGQGASFCTSQNCKTAHHHASVKTVQPGDIYIAKSATTAFLTPSIMESVVDSDVLKEWSSLFLIATQME
jgi:hypothetical protein